MDLLTFIIGDMTPTEVYVSIVSLITTVVGLYYLGIKRATGYIWFTISLSCQMYLLRDNVLLVTQMIILIVLNIRNYRKWKLEEKCE